jgi:uncharacterized cupin superfamily protein
MTPVLHEHDVEPRAVEAGDLAFARRTLGIAAGAVGIGISHYVVPPGRRQMPVHQHGDEEEVFFVLSGAGLSWQGGEACAVTAGDTIVHPPKGAPHTFLAAEDSELELLALGSGSDTRLTYLPRAGVMWAGPRWVPLDAPHPFQAEAAVGALERPPAGARPANVVALADVEPKTLRTGVEVRRAGSAAGAAKSGLNHATLPAGALSTPPHVHDLEEEAFFVLEGTGTLLLGADEHPLAAGDVVVRPPASGVSHALRGGPEGMTYLAYGTRVRGDSVYLPETGQVRLRGLGVTIDVR